MTEETASIDRRQVQEQLEQMRSDLAGWAEPVYDARSGRSTPAGYLYPTEPDAAARALIRIELRAAIATLARILDEPADPAIEKAQRRDRMRIADDAVENYKLEVVAG